MKFPMPWKCFCAVKVLFVLSIANLFPVCAQTTGPAAQAASHVPVTDGVHGAVKRASAQARVVARISDAEAFAAPAAVTLENGTLTVAAENSDLCQILREVARMSGMTVTGLEGGPRVYGLYGPADLRLVLASLLLASGYNFMMVGGDSVPRELVLSRERKAPPADAAGLREPEPKADDPVADYYAEQGEPVAHER